MTATRYFTHLVPTSLSPTSAGSVLDQDSGAFSSFWCIVSLTNACGNGVLHLQRALIIKQPTLLCNFKLMEVVNFMFTRQECLRRCYSAVFLASRRLLRLGVRRLRRHASQPAPPVQMCHQVSPGCVLSRRCGPAASATIDEEISATGPGGNTLLMGGTSPWKRMTDVCCGVDSLRRFLSSRQRGPTSHPCHLSHYT